MSLNMKFGPPFAVNSHDLDGPLLTVKSLRSRVDVPGPSGEELTVQILMVQILRDVDMKIFSRKKLWA